MADLYGAITDDAVNRIINFLYARAPYLFNYVAPSVKLQTDDAGNVTGFVDHWLTCSEVAPAPPPGVPRYRRIPPLPLPGVAMKLRCSIQLIDLNIDFHPSDAVALPAEMAPPLADQRFAIQGMVQFGLACVPASAVKTPGIRFYTHDIPVTRLPVLPVASLHYFTSRSSPSGTSSLVVTEVSGRFKANSSLAVRLEEPDDGPAELAEWRAQRSGQALEAAFAQRSAARTKPAEDGQ